MNNILKAISASLLMEQVLAPVLTFKARKNDDGDSEDVLVSGLREPSTDRVKEIVSSDLTELKAAILQDSDIQKSFIGEVDLEVVNKIMIPKIIMTKYPDLQEEEVEEVREHLVTDMVLRKGITTDSTGTRFLQINNKFINIEKINIDLIDSVNPFQQAFEVISKTITPKVLKSIQDCISAFKVSMTDDEAIFLWPKINDFVRTMRRHPSLDSLDPTERRLAEALTYLRQLKRGYKNENE